MCVILQCDDHIPKLDMLQDAQKTNPHGGGFAYTKDGLVHWEKGIHVNAQYVNEYVKRNKLTKKNNLIVHFRIATHGEVNDMMCHPFPLGMNKDGSALSNRTRGTTRQSVMFHNGVWSEYDEFAVKLAFNSPNIRIPDGDMSDSSIMAWCASHKGINFLEFTGEKVIVLSPDGIDRFGDGWTKVNNISCSNDLFDPTPSWGDYGGNFTYKAKESNKTDNKIQSLDDYEDNYQRQFVDGSTFYCADELDYLDGNKIKAERYDKEPNY